MTKSPLIKNKELFLDDKPSIYALRQQAKSLLEKNGFPTLKTEAWKYTNISNLINKDFDINNQQSECHCHNNSRDDYFINICFCCGLLHIEEYKLPDGLIIDTLPVALYEDLYKKQINKSFSCEKHPFATLNTVYIEQGICICVTKNTNITQPIKITYKNTECINTQNNIHNLFILEKNSKLNIVEEYISQKNNSYLSNIINEIYLDDFSELNHYKALKESQNSFHIALNSIKIKSNAQYNQFYCSNASKLSRNENLINLEKDNARTNIYSAYKTKKDCLTDITTNIYHLAKETKSNQYAKCVLSENSSAVFQGKIHIAPNSEKSQGEQLHKALYLNNNASLNCKPELEIYTDDVKCSHGASCGEINPEQLFYLTSRGINKDQAIKILTDAHLDEILSLIKDEKIKEILINY